jgi:hypothetical protein
MLHHFMKKRKYKNLSEVTGFLPKRSFSIRNAPMEPVTLIIVGKRGSIKKTFKAAGWYQAMPIGFISSFRSVLSTLLNRSYREGPMWPAFIDGKHHQIGFELPTQSDTYRRRHHLRLWRTGLSLPKGQIWTGTLSYDRSVGLFPGSVMPTHHISSNLTAEEEFLARTLKIHKPLYIKLAEPEKGIINTGDDYNWSGKALVLEL